MYKWTILDVTANELGLITSAKYKASISDNKTTIETEGNCFFQEPKLNIPFEEVTEENVVEWVKKETTQYEQNSVEYGLNEQLKLLASQRDTVAPWLPQVFTPNI